VKVKLKNMVTGTLVLTLLFLSGCGGGGDAQKVAEQFLDRYYAQANVQEAKALATPEMAQTIEEQFALFAQVVQLEKGRNHGASFAMKETNQAFAFLGSRPEQEDHAYFKYEAKITTKESDPVYKSIVLSVDRVEGAWRITQFDERATGPTETIR
jgi:hypothetical protein